MRTMALIAEAAAKATDILSGVAAAANDLAGEEFESLPDHALIDSFAALGKIIQSYSGKYTWLSAAGGLPLGILMQNLFGVLGPEPMVINAWLQARASITSAIMVSSGELARGSSEIVHPLLQQLFFYPALWNNSFGELPFNRLSIIYKRIWP